MNYTIEMTRDKSYKGPNDRFNLHDENSNELGYAVARLDPAKRENTMALSELYIKPENRGQGLSKVLIDKVKKEYKDNDIVLRANPYKDKSIDKDGLKDMYRKHGFVNTEGKSKKEKSSNDIMMYKRAGEEKIANIFTKKDIHVTKPSNVTLVTGFSGSGKTSLSNKLENKNTIVVELDGFQHNYDSTGDHKIVSDFINKHGTYNESTVTFKDIMEYLFDIARKNPDKNYVIEGVQYLGAPKKIFEDHSVHLKGTGLIKSSIRRLKRDRLETPRYADKSIVGALRYNLRLNKDINSLRKQLNNELRKKDLAKIAHYKEIIKTASNTKPTYKNTGYWDASPDNDEEAWTAKIDGAHTIIDMKKGMLPEHYSHRISKKDNNNIPYNEKLTHIVTPSLYDAKIRGETFAVDKDGNAVDPQVVSQILTRKPDRAKQLQDELGIKTITALIDVDEFEGRDLRFAPFKEKREILQSIADTTPEYIFPDTAYTREEKMQLRQDIIDGKNRQTKEGYVVHNLLHPKNPFTKAKIIDHHDVYVVGIFEEENVKDGRKKMAGGFTYSWEENGVPVGKVGSGFNHAEKEDMLRNPNKYIGRVAMVKALGISANKVLLKPSFDGWHLDKNLR